MQASSLALSLSPRFHGVRFTVRPLHHTLVFNFAASYSQHMSGTAAIIQIARRTPEIATIIAGAIYMKSR